MFDYEIFRFSYDGHNLDPDPDGPYMLVRDHEYIVEMLEESHHYDLLEIEDRY